MTSAVASGSSKVNSNQPQSRSHKKREASSDEPLEFTSHEVKSLSTSRMTKSRLQDQVQDDWKKGRDRKNHANMFLSALIDSETSSAAPLSLTNAIDNQPCPSWDFALTDGYVRAESVPPSNLDDLEGCGCRDECDPKNCNCFQKHIKLAPDTWKACKDIKQDFAYDRNGRLRAEVLTYYNTPIWECNSKCGCSDDCRNRVVQKGRTVGLDIYKDPLCGWGVRAREQILPGTFVINYWGELLGEIETAKRCLIYDKVVSTYVLDLDHYHITEYRRNQPYKRHLEMTGRKISNKERLSKKFNEEADKWLTEEGKNNYEYSVDASLWGNAARFINHSCSANLTIFPVYLEESDIARPVHALFANRVIERGEALSFNYRNNGVESSGEEEEDDEDEDEDGWDDQPLSRRRRGVSHASSNGGIKKNEKKKLNAMLAEAKPGQQEVSSGGVFAMNCRCKSENCKGTIFKKKR